jgi:CRISPR-associated protein Cmr4
MSDTPTSGPVARLLFLHAQTGLHPGSGTALGAVDLPVQRERHTNWPTIPGSALKGILRDRCREEARSRHDGSRKEANEKDDMIVAVFGPGKVEDVSHAGALSVTDARILAFPVRSLRGVFAWVTCPAVLTRLARDLKLAGQTLALPDGPKGDTEALCADGSPLLVEGNKLVLEEFEFRHTGAFPAVADWLAAHVTDDEGTRKRLPGHLAVLSDNYFTHFVRNATEIVARVGLDYEKKTVKEGALFYQEFLPPETLFYALVLTNDSRYDKKKDLTAAQVLSYLAGQLRHNNLLQIGGDETTGKGLCLVRLDNGKGA